MRLRNAFAMLDLPFVLSGVVRSDALAAGWNRGSGVDVVNDWKNWNDGRATDTHCINPDSTSADAKLCAREAIGFATYICAKASSSLQRSEHTWLASGAPFVIVSMVAGALGASGIPAAHAWAALAGSSGAGGLWATEADKITNTEENKLNSINAALSELVTNTAGSANDSEKQITAALVAAAKCTAATGAAPPAPANQKP